MKNAYQCVAGFVSILLFCLNASPSTAQNESFDAAEQVPASIHGVTSGGLWTSGYDEGFFRTVVTASGVEHVTHQLFIQWLRIKAKNQGYELVRTVSVKELNLSHGHTLEVKTSFGEVNSFKIDITAYLQDGNAKRFAITVKGDGTYAIQSR